jgi:hypothetical protein
VAARRSTVAGTDRRRGSGGARRAGAGQCAREVEPLDPGALTLAIVLDDGPAVPPEAVALQQGAANELVLNLPRRVELMVSG